MPNKPFATFTTKPREEGGSSCEALVSSWLKVRSVLQRLHYCLERRAVAQLAPVQLGFATGHRTQAWNSTIDVNEIFTFTAV